MVDVTIPHPVDLSGGGWTRPVTLHSVHRKELLMALPRKPWKRNETTETKRNETISTKRYETKRCSETKRNETKTHTTTQETKRNDWF